MDYLKYLLLSFLFFALIIAGGDFFGAQLGMFAFIGATMGYMIRYRPASHATSYMLWIASFCLWYRYISSILAEREMQHPEKYTADKHDFVMGFLLFIGAIVFHPVCYGIGKLTLLLWNKSLKLRKPQDSI